MKYKFQCNNCFVVSGIISNDTSDSPPCCGGHLMTPILLNENINFCQERNWKYTPGIGHYKDCTVYIGECVCP